jgi:DNA-binding NtrC family response regulator
MSQENSLLPEGRVDGLTALIAEDEPELLKLVSQMLEDIGVHVLRAGNGNQALMIQEDYEGDIDFLLTDVVMPELNGVKLAELFQACRPESKVLFMSGYPANGQMARVNLPEDALLMPKPVNFEALKSVVRSLAASGNDNNLLDLKKLRVSGGLQHEKENF